MTITLRIITLDEMDRYKRIAKRVMDALPDDIEETLDIVIIILKFIEETYGYNIIKRYKNTKVLGGKNPKT